jgi:hypothetical protein
VWGECVPRLLGAHEPHDGVGLGRAAIRQAAGAPDAEVPRGGAGTMHRRTRAPAPMPRVQI